MQNPLILHIPSPDLTKIINKQNLQDLSDDDSRPLYKRGHLVVFQVGEQREIWVVAHTWWDSKNNAVRYALVPKGDKEGITISLFEPNLMGIDLLHRETVQRAHLLNKKKSEHDWLVQRCPEVREWISA